MGWSESGFFRGIILNNNLFSHQPFPQILNEISFFPIFFVSVQTVDGAILDQKIYVFSLLS